jgi:hypothetical protein
VMKTRLLSFLKDVGLLDEVPAEDPGKGRVLARGVCPPHDGADARRYSPAGRSKDATGALSDRALARP